MTKLRYGEVTYLFQRKKSKEFETYLPELEDLAADVARPPLDGDRPHCLAGQAEQGHEEVGHGEVEDHGAEAGAVAVAEDGEDGRQVGQQ